MNDEIFLDKELLEMLAMLKTIERKMIECDEFDKDVFIIHLATLQGRYDMSAALELLKCMYKVEDDTE